MKNANPRGFYNLNRRKEDSGYVFVVIVLAIIVLISMFSCTPRVKIVNAVVHDNGDVYILSKQGKRMVAAKNGVPYRVSYIK